MTSSVRFSQIKQVREGEVWFTISSIGDRESGNNLSRHSLGVFRCHTNGSFVLVSGKILQSVSSTHGVYNLLHSYDLCVCLGKIHP